jgi:hypothetical protein
MVVFGFGRGPGTQPQLRGAGQRFTVGLLEMSVTDAVQHARLAEKTEAAIVSQETSAAPRPRSIDLRHGSRQQFGQRGEPQCWISVLGDAAWTDHQGSMRPLTGTLAVTDPMPCYNLEQ